MIVKIFKPTVSFSAVRYNTSKVDRQKGELMKVANFGPLETFGHLKPQDYINYLSALTRLNRNVKLPQFHAIISGKGKTYDKTNLTNIAENWLQEMGYGRQPYLIVYHKDTENNHVHLVSTRVDKNGRKISSAFEHIRAQKSISKVLGYDLALQYRFGTRAQFFMILESLGSPGKDPNEDRVKEKIEGFVLDKKRASQIALLLNRYKNGAGYQDLLKDRFKIELIFHSSAGKKPYGYSIIDHDTCQVFKGSEVLPLKELLNEPLTTYSTEIPVITTGEEYVEADNSYVQSVMISDDVDDQQIHGMRRRRQKKARTNTR